MASSARMAGAAGPWCSTCAERAAAVERNLRHQSTNVRRLTSHSAEVFPFVGMADSTPAAATPPSYRSASTAGFRGYPLEAFIFAGTTGRGESMK